VTQWLLSQLPGADPEQLGWAVLDVIGDFLARPATPPDPS
jgi:hypothetical protein